MKVLFLTPHLSTGGMPQFLLQRIKALQAYSDVEVFGSDENGVEYSAIGSYSCDELVDIDEDSIEEWHKQNIKDGWY